MNILVVDDEPVNCRVIQNSFNIVGGKTIMANSGREALQLLNSTTLPDVVLMDVMMPQMNGYEVTLAIREKFDPERGYLHYH